MKTLENYNPISNYFETAKFSKINNMTGRIISAELAYELGNGYNPQEWRKIIDRYSKFKNVTFFYIPKDQLIQYDRFFVIYTTTENITFFKSVSYSSMLSSNGFCFITYNVNTSGEVTFERGVIGENGRIANNDIARKYISQLDVNSGIIISNEF